MFNQPAETNSIGVNFAPTNALTRYADDENSYRHSSVADFIRNVFLDLSQRNQIEKREINESARLMASLRSGKLLMTTDPIQGNLTLIKPLPRKSNSSNRHNYPLAQVNSTQLTSIWSQSRTTLTVQDFGNTNQSKIVQATLEKVLQQYGMQMDEAFHQRQSLAAMDYGTIAVRTQYDERLNQLRQILPIMENKSVVAHEGYGYCKTCGTEGTPADFQLKGESVPRCQKCGSFQVGNLVEPTVIEAPQIVGKREIIQGDIAIDLVPIGSLNWDMRYFIQDSLWAIQLTEVPTSYVRSIVKADIADYDPNWDDGLRVINETGTRGGSVAGWGRDNLYGNYDYKPGTTVMCEMWLKPEFYAGCRAERDEETVGGVTIKKGQEYTEVFSKGIAALGFNYMQVIPGVYNEKCRIRSTVYHIQSNSGVGKGTTDSLEVSEHLNIAHSAAMTVLKKYAGGGGTAFDSDLITAKQAQALLSPKGLVGVKMRGSNYTSVDQAIKRMETGQIDNGNLNLIAQLSNMLNIVFQTTDFTSGVADSRVDVNTLGGQQMLQAQNMQRSAAPLRMKSFLHSQIGTDVLELFREHIQYPKLIGSNDKFSLTKGKYLTGKDIPKNIKCIAVPDSELPINRLTRRDNFERLLTQTGQAGVNFFEIATANGRAAAWMADEFGVDMPLFNYTEILVVCQNRLEKVLQKAQEEEEVMQMSGFMVDPQMLAESVIDQLLPPVTATEDNLVIKAQVLSEYLDDEAVEQWTPLQQAAVQALIWRHYRSDRDFRGGLMALEQETQLGLEANAANQQMAMAAEQQNQMNESEAAKSAGQILGQAVADEDQFDREEEKADNQAKRDSKNKTKQEKK